MSRRRTKGRNVDGILLLDKPVGLTSNEALQQVKWLFQARKAGHTGSLDPLADGLLPLCFGGATKVSAFLLDADKHYRVRIRLGETTTTADAEGEITERRAVPELSLDAIEAVLARFTGPIEQLPPMYSALKYKGERLYNLARRGIEVERTPRTVEIHALRLLAWVPPELELEVHCSKGTYVRTLAEDIGVALGCGAHVSALRRTGVGPYEDASAIGLTDLQARAEAGLQALDTLLLPMDSALGAWPAVRLSVDTAYYLAMGQPVLVPKAPTRGRVRLYGADGAFLGVGEILDDGRVAPRRLLHGD